MATASGAPSAPPKSLSATLTARVENALEAVPIFSTEADVREALLALSGAGLLSADCTHGPGECDGEESSPEARRSRRIARILRRKPGGATIRLPPNRSPVLTAHA